MNGCNVSMICFVFCRQFRVVDGNNRCYILCHPTLYRECGGGDIAGFKVRVIILREDTPTSVLLGISAGR